MRRAGAVDTRAESERCRMVNKKTTTVDGTGSWIRCNRWVGEDESIVGQHQGCIDTDKPAAVMGEKRHL